MGDLRESPLSNFAEASCTPVPGASAFERMFLGRKCTKDTLGGPGTVRRKGKSSAMFSGWRINFAERLVQQQQRIVVGLLLIAYMSFLVIVNLWPFEFYGNGVRWIEGANGVDFEQPGQVISSCPSQWFYERLLSGSGLSVEVWLQSLNDTQVGPARIVSYSLNQTMRNFTLGQSEKKLVMRLRTTETNVNGMEPQLEPVSYTHLTLPTN